MVDQAKIDGGLPGLRYLDTFMGINPLVSKLPRNLQEKWRSRAFKYKKENKDTFPPFAFFAKFVKDLAEERNDPSLTFTKMDDVTRNDRRPTRNQRYARVDVGSHKTEVIACDPEKTCPIHNKPHPLRNCRAFRNKTLEERKSLLRELKTCFNCVASTKHIAKDCKTQVKCDECGSQRHHSALHSGPPKAKLTETHHGGETPEANEVMSKCPKICGEQSYGKSCSKICLVHVYLKNDPNKVIKAYAVLDDQSNRSLARTELFDKLDIKTSIAPYTLRTCAGISSVAGRRANGIVIQSVDKRINLASPTLIECNAIPDCRAEIPTPEAAKHHPHLQSIADKIPPLNPDADILLLIGRDLAQAHKIREVRNGPNNAPWAQRLDLGWVVVGDVCLGNAHKGNHVGSYHTSILENGRPTYFKPCENRIVVKERQAECNSSESKAYPAVSCELGAHVFRCTPNDNKIGMSSEDKEFMLLMNNTISQNAEGNWVAPLPFRRPKERLPNNRENAMNRLKSLLRSFKKTPTMREHYFSFMEKVLSNGHAEVAPELDSNAERWYLPHFGVYHSRKPGKIRVVFDSSAEFQETSLNKTLLSGPDLMNDLLGILIRFRQDSVAFMADVEQMFHSFVVREDHRDYLRFLWFSNNDPEAEIIEYRMKVHIFGNSPSPAVANFGLRKTAEVAEKSFGTDARRFVERNFYVDDGLKSLPTDTEAIDLLQRTQAMLATANLRLHKIASNSSVVMQAFPSNDYASDLKGLDFKVDSVPMKRSLGVYWDLKADVFTFSIADDYKPFTKRGVLSDINSLYDPIGFAAPVVIKGKILLREMTSNENLDWDDDLPQHLMSSWRIWRDSLSDLSEIKIPRPYTPFSTEKAIRRELHTFSDASDKAIGAVAYLRITNDTCSNHVSLVLGKSKLGPKQATTIPRLQLCAAVLAVEVAELVIAELDFEIDAKYFYSDSRVVIGYITNRTRRFYIYVSNRVERILKSTKSEEWHYISTNQNPADRPSRGLTPSGLIQSTWLTGPDFLRKHGDHPITKQTYPILSEDPEVRAYDTKLDTTNSLGSARFTKFSRWSCLLKSIAKLIHITESYQQNKSVHKGCKGWHICSEADACENQIKAKTIVLRNAQLDDFREEITNLKAKKPLPKTSRLLKLSPFIDENGLVRVGGRLSNANLSQQETHPVILSNSNHVTTLIIRHHHELVHHQGRHFTHGAVRSAGYWILGGKANVASVLTKCITCKKLRGKEQQQKMADLPIDRVTPSPPFTYVGLDVFGPWTVCTRRTRGGQANGKRWAVLFTCMTCRAIHIEVIESMDSSSFINALRRFFAIRGAAKLIRSDCGTNFVGAVNELKAGIQKFSNGVSCKWEWKFNPPHASHMGGIWERMIGVTRRILDSMFKDLGPTQLSHELLTTFMAEVVAIVNSRPLIPISNDPEAPELLTPNMLLTQKPSSVNIDDGTYSQKELFGRQWRRVQYLANVFWVRWRRDYLPTLQNRKKWNQNIQNLDVGDIVMMKRKELHRNDWPMCRVVNTFPSDDKMVRKVEVQTWQEGTFNRFVRPIQELVLLIKSEGVSTDK